MQDLLKNQIKVGDLFIMGGSKDKNTTLMFGIVLAVPHTKGHYEGALSARLLPNHFLNGFYRVSPSHRTVKPKNLVVIDPSFLQKPAVEALRASQRAYIKALELAQQPKKPYKPTRPAWDKDFVKKVRDEIRNV